MATLQGHRGRGVWRCVLLPGGRAATAGADGSLKLWPLAHFGVQPAPTQNDQDPDVVLPGSQRLPQQAPYQVGRLLTVDDASAGCAGSKQMDGPRGGGGDRVGGGALRCPLGVEALSLDYAHLAGSAAAAEAERTHPSEALIGIEPGLPAPPAGHAAGSSTPAPALRGCESAGASGQAVFFRRADGSTAAEWVRCLGFAGNPDSPDPGMLYVATQRGLLHRVRLPRGLGCCDRATWQRVWACPLEGHPMCMAVRVSTAAAVQDGQAASAGCGVIYASVPASGAPVGHGASGAALQGCSGGGGAGAGSAPNAADLAPSHAGAVCCEAQTCAAWDSVLLGGFTGWAACVWVPAASGADRASGTAPNHTDLKRAAHDARSPMPPGLCSPRHGAAASAAACAAGVQAGQDCPGDRSVPGVEAVSWQAHPGSAVHRILWVPELGPCYAATTDSLGAMRLWRLPEPLRSQCSQRSSSSSGEGLSGSAAMPCICLFDGCLDSERPSSGRWASAMGAEADVVERDTGSGSGPGAGSAAAAPQLWAEAHSPYGEPLTCMAVAPARRMLVAGDALGSILVFELPREGAPVLNSQHSSHNLTRSTLCMRHDVA